MNDATNNPISSKEIEWLLSFKREILLFGGDESKAVVDIYAKSLDITDNIMKSNEKIFVEYDDQSEYKFINQDAYALIEHFADEFGGILDAESILYSETSIYVIVDEIDTYIPVNTMLIDLKSIFLIFKRRYNIIGQINAVQEARIRTLKILDNIVDTYQGKSMISLLLYLTYNCVMLEVEEFKILDYIHLDEKDINYEYLDNVMNKCKALYQILIECINNIR